MSTLFIQIWAAALLAVASLATQADESVVVKNLDLFVDPPTGFAFVKMPEGWKFVGKLDSQAMRQLPSGVHTSLLPHDTDNEVSRVAQPGKSGTGRIVADVVHLPSQFPAPAGAIEALPAQF